MSYANVTTKLDYLNPVLLIGFFSICSFIWMIFLTCSYIHLPCFVCVLSFKPLHSGWFQPVLLIGLLNSIVLSFEFFFLFISFVCVLLFYPIHTGWFEPVLYIAWISIVLSFELFFLLPVPSSASFSLSYWQPLWPPWPSRLPLVSFEVPFRSRVSPEQEKAIQVWKEISFTSYLKSNLLLLRLFWKKHRQLKKNWTIFKVG